MKEEKSPLQIREERIQTQKEDKPRAFAPRREGDKAGGSLTI